jgi:coproporphyrinogen III oxidase
VRCLSFTQCLTDTFFLYSLPQTARWEYMSDMGAPGSGTREEELMKVLKNPRDWADV